MRASSEGASSSSRIQRFLSTLRGSNREEEDENAQATQGRQVPLNRKRQVETPGMLQFPPELAILHICKELSMAIIPEHPSSSSRPLRPLLSRSFSAPSVRAPPNKQHLQRPQRAEAIPESPRHLASTLSERLTMRIRFSTWSVILRHLNVRSRSYPRSADRNHREVRYSSDSGCKQEVLSGRLSSKSSA